MDVMYYTCRWIFATLLKLLKLHLCSIAMTPSLYTKDAALFYSTDLMGMFVCLAALMRRKMIQEGAEEGERGRERTEKESGRVKGVKERMNTKTMTLVSVSISSQVQL